MAEPWEWEEQDLLDLIERHAEENTELDFKRCLAIDLSDRDKTKRDMSKDVSAFANAAGGALLYGMIEEDHVAHQIDVGYDPNEVTREWIEQVINANVHPRVPGVKVKTVQLPQKSPGRVAYVAWIPRGTTAHQASDKLYYRRHGTECLAMEDYEIRDVMQRTSAPSVSLELEIDGKIEGQCRFQSTGSKEKLLLSSPAIKVVAKNDPDAATCQYSQHQIFLETDLETRADIAFQEKNLVGYAQGSFLPSTTIIESSKESLTFGYYQVDLAPDDMPIFPNERRELCVLRFHIPEPAVYRKQYFVLWRSRASNSEVQAGAVCFTLQEGLDFAFSPVSFEWLADRGSQVTLTS